MIRFSLRSGIYTKKQLNKILSPYFDKKLDIDLFLESIIETKQVVKKGINYIFPESKRRTYTKPRYTSFPTYKYAGVERVGVRAGASWVKKHGYPTDMFISKALIKGEWVRIPGKQRLKLVKGRYPTSIEAWRAEVPFEIRKKYGITPDTPIRVRIDTTAYQYLAILQLWGYRYRVMLSYGETKNGVNPRSLEIDGRSFVHTVKRDISETIERDQQRIKKTILGLLSDADEEYYNLYEETVIAGKDSENIEAIPLARRTALVPIVELRDLDNKRIIINWDTSTEKTKIPSISEFNTSSTIDHSISSARGQTKLTKRWSNKGGFK